MLIMKFHRSLIAGFAGLLLAASASAAGGAEHAHAPKEGWAFEGTLGKFDKASVQRGYQVYKEVCSSCHSMKLMSYRNLGEKGGPFYDPEFPNAADNPFVKALAADNQVISPVPNDVGDYDVAAATPASRFRSPYANDAQARAANAGALPPDLSVITKARHGGASYIYSLLTGYPDEGAFNRRERPATAAEKASEAAAAAAKAEAWTKETAAAVAAGLPTPAPLVPDAPLKYYDTVIDVAKVKAGTHGDAATHDAAGHGESAAGTLLQPAGLYYNPWFTGDTTPNYDGDPRHAPKGGFLAMAPQLLEGRVSYTDGTVATTEQMAKDVAQFLAWAGEPKQTARKSLGLAVMPFLLLLSVLLWFSYKRVWRKVEH
jgi:ubiquinol-cytochrome c reductase cytochrome c1 subunit